MHGILRVALSLILLAGCKSELSKDDVELFAAVAFVTWGMEEGNNKFSAERVDRAVLPDAVQYTVYSKKDGPPGMTMTVKSPNPCVFTLAGLRTDGLLTLDFNKATSARYETPSNFFAYLRIEGPKVYCEVNKCEDEKSFLMLEQRGTIDLPENRAIAFRKIRALAFIQNKCPGKSF